MRPALLLLATAALYVSAAKVGCPQHLFEELVARTSCGDNRSISKCLLLNVNLGRLNEIEQCYIAGGCPKAEATVGAVWLAHQYRAEVREEDERLELRRRADSTEIKSDSATETSQTTPETTPTTFETTQTTPETTTEKKTTAETTVKSTSAATTTESSAAASSTAAASSAAATTTSTGSTAASTAAATTSTTTSSTSSTSGSTILTTTGTLLCSTTSTVQTSACSVSHGKTISCSAILVATASCVPGLLCMVNTDGESTCMKIDNTIGVGGIIIAIVFGGAIVASMLGLIVMKCTASKAAKNKEREQEALLSAYNAKRRAADVEAYAPQASEATLPLILEPGQEYGGERFTDYGRRAPQLHQGLGTLGLR